MAIPITFLLLFVSLLLIITATYYLAMTNISAQGQTLNFSEAKQSMIGLENTVSNVLWSPGASEVYLMNDFGGNFETIPTAKTLLINITDGVLTDTIFSSPTGEAVYEMANGEPGANGLYLEGDARTIVNSSASTMTQLGIATGETFQEIMLSYRPLASSTITGSSVDKPVNTVQVYVVSMNLSQSLTLSGAFYLKAQCLSVVSSTRSYNISYQASALQVNALLDGTEGAVSLPISSSSFGAMINVEVLVCNVKLQTVEV
ncbi:MAG TPA: hypothetical protein VK487_03275 [Candidatus Bathyarchaeia archaeon]|nr:hypothetical protein [Candidatus Bathyarchaeia archaeon]